MANRNSGMGKRFAVGQAAGPGVAAGGVEASRSPGPPRNDRHSSADRPATPAAAAWWPSAVMGPSRHLLNEQPSVPLTVFPAGTENLVARHFGLGRDPEVLANDDRGRPGRSASTSVSPSGRRFLLMAGFGFDGDIVTRHHRGRRVPRSGSIRPTHRIAYVVPILRSSLSYRFPPITVRIVDAGAEEVLTGTTVFVFNAPRYALGLPFVPTARDDDGWLDLIVFRKPGPFKLCITCGKSFVEPTSTIRACFIAGPRNWL